MIYEVQVYVLNSYFNGKCNNQSGSFLQVMNMKLLRSAGIAYGLGIDCDYQIISVEKI